MQCPNCQHENPKEALFCMKCGTKLERKCPHCGAEYPEEAVFCMKCGAKLVEVAPTLTEIAAPPKLEDMQDRLYIPKPLAEKMSLAAKQMEGENRLVTALFADISGFTPLSTQHSPEKVVEVVNDCFKAIVDVILSYEGSINRFIGDCVLAFFGAPIIHENDPERAILAALQMREEVAKLDLDISVGINSGMMYFGEIGTEQHVEYSAYGPDINLAKRLQESAKPGQILVGVGTYRHTRRAFDFNSIEGLTVKGITQPVTAYEMLKVKERPEKLRGLEGLRARMIGREREFTDLKEAADELLAGHGQMVSIIGEAGIGKSRLATELKEYLKDKEVQLYEGRCISIGQQISYWPFLDILRNYFDLRQEDTEKERGEKIIKAMNKLFRQRAEEFIPFIGTLMSVKFGDDYDEKRRYLTAEQIRHLTLMRLNDTFVVMARENPLLLVLEDFHWADDLSLDLVSLLMDELASSPLMLLCIYRPEKEHRSFQMGQMASRKCPDLYAEITLKNLSTRESRQLVESLLAIENLPSKVKEMILQKSEGNPFFIEEVVRSLIASDIIYREGDRWKARESIESISVPDTVQGVILSRVDKLHSEVKYVLQCASVIGRIFRYRLLGYLAQQERELDRRLEKLEEKELVYEERSVPELEYAFKHVLTQEATYGGILERQRLMFHHQVGEGIEALYRKRLEEYYEELAYHYSRSTDKEKALEYLIKAGDKSKALYANQQAIDYYTRAMALSKSLPEERTEQKLSILDGLGDVYHLIGKSDEAIQSYESALKYSEDRRRRADIYRKIAGVYSAKLQPDLVLKYIDTAIDELGQDTHSVEMARICIEAMRIFCLPPWSGYDPDKALDYGFRILSIVEGTEHKRELVEACHNLADIYTYRGDSDRAIQYAQKALSTSQETGDANLMGYGHFTVAFVNQRINSRIAVKHLKECIELYRKAGNIRGMVTGYMTLSGVYYWQAKDSESAIKCCKEGTELDKERKFPVDTGHMIVYLSQIYRDKGEWDEAIKYAQEALHIGATTGSYDLFLASPPYEVLIEAYLVKGEFSKALDYSKKAVNLSINPSNSDRLKSFLGFAEEIYEKTGNHAEFISFCHETMAENGEKLKGIKLTLWYLEPKELSGQFTQTVFSDEFDGSVLCPEWQWVNPRGNCRYELNSEPSWLEIRAAYDCDLQDNNFNAPRLLQGISDDFGIETKMAPADEGILTVGGLLVWKNENNYIRFERGMQKTYRKNEIRLSGSVNGKCDHFGRGMLVSEVVYLRMERIGDTFSAYCSSDSENWLTCGEVSFPAEDPIQVGIHAIGDNDWWRGSTADTATRFDYFRVLRRHPS